MRPLPRLLAFADERIAALDDLGVRAAAIAAAGPAVGLVARLPGGTIDALAALGLRFVALATPPMANVFVTGRADVAAAVGANGVILRKDDISVRDVRTIAHRCVLRSVHSFAEAEAAIADGADALIVGSIWSSATHPGIAPAGTGLVEEVVSLGRPTYAIGGVTPDRAAAAKHAGAWGVAAITAVWDAANPYEMATELVQPWT